MSEDPQFEALIDYIKSTWGVDFTGYKRSSLGRRVNRRMQMLNLEGYDNFQAYLAERPEEFSYLLNTLLVNVTSFFRDRPVWDYLSSEIVPQILARKNSREIIRIWSAGCATGEEAYTIAIVMAQILGIDQVRERVRIYATDLDENALDEARLAAYSPHQLAALSPEQIEQFFEPSKCGSESGYTIREELRRPVIFGCHDLVQDAPITRIDLLMCRNTLMYFDVDTQARILARFHFALCDGGFLCLGKAEMPAFHSSLFSPVALNHRVFIKGAKPNLSDRTLGLAQPGPEEAIDAASQQMQIRLREAAFESCPVARLVVDPEGVLTLANKRVRTLFHLSLQDLGRPLQDLEISYRPVELRSHLEKAYREHCSICLHDIAWLTPQGETVYLDVHITPLLDVSNSLLGASISFTDVTRYKQLQEAMAQSNQKLERVYEELQSTPENRQPNNEKP
ncbi:MAG TPA: CheR family methyltransferase [Leptolyngbyaceae cyanobacterium]